MFSRFEKVLIALMFAFVFAGVTLVAVSAQDETPPPVATQENTADCATCHEDSQMSWQNGPHGHAKDDPIFVNAWTEQGKPGACLTCHVTGYDEATGTWKEDGVTCAACHTDEGGQHPKTTMKVDSTSGTCGTCHTDARFGLKDWEGSTHYAEGMDCSSCHDPHNASLKITINLKDPDAPKDASRLCISCHEEASMNFPYSKHNAEGITCIDCHLGHLENANTDIHQVADHSFKASVQTCNACHADQMHANGEAAATQETSNISLVEPANEPAPAVEEPAVTPEPSPVSPIGYAALAALVGIGAGMLLAPFLERWYRKAVTKSAEVDHDDEK
jgi:predicted CXXCH cytochrome family protein